MRMRVERQCSVEQWGREIKSGMRFLVCCMMYDTRCTSS